MCEVNNIETSISLATILNNLKGIQLVVDIKVDQSIYQPTKPPDPNNFSGIQIEEAIDNFYRTNE